LQNSGSKIIEYQRKELCVSKIGRGPDSGSENQFWPFQAFGSN
jgi:hypothetical protein